MTGLVTKGRRQRQLKNWAYNNRKWKERMEQKEISQDFKPKELTCEEAVEKAKKAGLPLRF